MNQNDRLCGYSRRTAEILAAQQRMGIDADVCSVSDGLFMQTRFHDVISTITRVMGWSPERIWAADHQSVLTAVALAVGLDRARLCGWDVLHAHTPWTTAVACALHGPFVYEVRGLQEESAVVNFGWGREDDRYQLWHRMETWAREEALSILALCPTLADDAHQRTGRPVWLTPNAVDVERFLPVYRDAQSQPVFGYVGSRSPLEGVEWLVSAWPTVRARVPGARLRIVGPGDQIAASEGIEVEGPVEPSAVPLLLQSLDAVIIPRQDSVVTRNVTPLKPLEALACGTPVVASDLPALHFVGECGTVFFASGSAEALADACAQVLPRRRVLGREGREWVARERTWAQVAATQCTAYGSLA